MHAGYTYDEGNHAGSGSGIKLKASEPLSPNAFVQIPAEVVPVQTTVQTPISRQKRMRVPRGGSVERPVQRTPRRAADSMRLDETPSAPLSPSLHIFLEPDPEEEAPIQEEEPESLAQFVSSFPKIPNGLIFQTPEGDDEDEASASEDAAHEEDAGSFDQLDDEGTRTIRLDEGELPGAAPWRGGGAVVRSDPRAAERRRTRAAAASERLVPDGNPRFEKMIKDATAQRTGLQSVARPAAPSVFEGKGAGAGIRAGQGAFAGAAAASFGRTSGPLSASVPERPGPFSACRPAANTGMSVNAPSASGSLGPRMAASAAAPARPYGAPGRTSRLNIPKPLLPTSGPIPLKPAGAVAGAAPATGSLMPTPGKPLLDPHAIEESTIFDEPPVPIHEGMKDADKSRSKGRTLIIVFLLLVIAALVGGFIFFSSHGSITIPEINITTTDRGTSGSSDESGSSSTSDQSSASGEDGNAAPVTGAGTVTYKYTAKTPGGVEYNVEESTTFDAQGNCTFTTMKMQFPSDAAAKDFTDDLARDLGSKYTLDSLNGANATVTVDNSALGLNREDYENALRYSVDDLVILKK